MIHGPNIQGSCATLFFEALVFIFTSRHSHSWASFPLCLSLFIPSAAISLLFSSGILDTYQPGGFIFLCDIFFAFLYCSWGSQGKKSGLLFPSSLDYILSPP